MRSLYVRVVVITMYTIALSGFLGYYVANVYYHWSLKSYHDEKLFHAAEHMRIHIEQYPESIGNYLQSSAALGYQLYLYDEQGNDIFYGRPFEANDLSTKIKEDVLSGSEYHGIADFPNRPFSTGYFEDRLSNTVGVHVTADVEHYALFLRQDSGVFFDELRVFFIVMFAFAVLLSFPNLLLSARYLVQPIVRLTEATKRIAQGQYDLELPTNRKDEVGLLASHFQKMSLELERSDQMKKEFVANVSHEIHSPLASIQGYADSLLDDGLDQEQIRHYATIIGQETRHLAALSRQLLLLSSINHSGYSLERKSFNLQPMLRQTLQLLEWQLVEKELAVRMLIPNHLIMRGDEVLLMQVWSNLLSNAVKHIPRGRSIHIQAVREHDCCIVTVSDTGEGIPQEMMPFIYDRFYRGDSARDRRTGSTGLGLSIVQKIVHLHGGSIEGTSEAGAGTTFVVRIPDYHEEAVVN